MGIKQILSVSLAVVTAITLMTGCSSEKPIPGFDENGNLLPAETINYEGCYYIKKQSTGEFFSLNNRGIGTQENTTYQWFTNGYEKYTPVLEAGDSLVYVNQTARPSVTSIYEMEDCGYSVGTIFEPFSEGGESHVRFSEIFCEYSPISSHVTSCVTDPKATKIVEINKTPFRRNMIDSIGFIHGLEENCMYQLCFYEGTVFKKVSLKADTHFFLSDTNYSSTSYIPEKDIFYTVVLPENLPNGFYYIPEMGSFEYRIEDNVMLPDGVSIDSLETAPETEAVETEAISSE